jgi:hypothetical protein
VEVNTPNFRVVSNNGERSAREVAWQPGPDSLPRRRTLLEKSIALNDGYAQSHQSLAPFRRAIELEPGQVGNYISLANVLGRLGKKDDALAIARAAMDVASNDAERRSVQALLDSLQRIK